MVNLCTRDLEESLQTNCLDDVPDSVIHHWLWQVTDPGSYTEQNHGLIYDSKCVYLYELNACTLVKSLVLCFTCPFQIASDRCLSCCDNTNLSMGPGCVQSICPAFAAAILHKNDKQLVWEMNTQYAYGTRYELEQLKPVCTMRI